MQTLICLSCPLWVGITKWKESSSWYIGTGQCKHSLSVFLVPQVPTSIKPAGGYCLTLSLVLTLLSSLIVFLPTPESDFLTQDTWISLFLPSFLLSFSLRPSIPSFLSFQSKIKDIKNSCELHLGFLITLPSYCIFKYLFSYFCLCINLIFQYLLCVVYDFSILFLIIFVFLLSLSQCAPPTRHASSL